MKKILLFAGIFLAAFTMNAQFTVETVQGDPISDGDVFTYGEVEASLEFFVYNTASEDINMKIEFVNATNADGSQMEICFGLCYTSVNIGQTYPSTPVIIAPGEHQATTGDHFLNRDEGNGTDVITYEFRFYQLDDSGHETGESLTVYYVYDATLAVNEASKLDMNLYPTVADNQLTIENGEPLEMGIYNLQGKLVKHAELPVGQNEIQVSDLAAQMYLVRFTNELGAVEPEKIVVR